MKLKNPNLSCNRTSGRRPTRMRLAAALIGVVGALGVIAGCGGDAGSSDPLAFNTDWVEVAVVSNEEFGGQDKVLVIGRGGPADNTRQVEQCLDHFLGTGDERGAFCWVFPSEAAFAYAKVDHTDATMENICWSARAAKPIQGDREVETQDPSFLEVLGCPE